jgi:hypothetical protein
MPERYPTKSKGKYVRRRVRTVINPFSRNLHSRDGISLFFEPKCFIRLDPKYRPTTNEIFPLMFSPTRENKMPYSGPNNRPEIAVSRDAGKKMRERKL